MMIELKTRRQFAKERPRMEFPRTPRARTVDRALLATLAMCWDQESLWSIKMPRYRTKGEFGTENSRSGVRSTSRLTGAPWVRVDHRGLLIAMNSVLSGSIRRPFRASHDVTCSKPWAARVAA